MIAGNTWDGRALNAQREMAWIYHEEGGALEVTVCVVCSWDCGGGGEEKKTKKKKRTKAKWYHLLQMPK